MKSMFSFMPLTYHVIVSDKFDTSNVESMNRMFAYFGNINGESKFGISESGSSLDDLVFPAFKIKQNCVLAEMFANAHLPVDLSGWTTPDNDGTCGLNNCSDYSDMFYQFAYYALPPIKIRDTDEPIGKPENLTITLPSSG